MKIIQISPTSGTNCVIANAFCMSFLQLQQYPIISIPFLSPSFATGWVAAKWALAPCRSHAMACAWKIGIAMDFPWCFNSIFVYCRDLGIICWNLTPTKSHKPFALSIVFHTTVWRRAGADCKSLKTSLAAATLPAWDGRMLLSENKFRCSSLIKWKTSTNSPWHLTCPRPSQKHSDHWGGAVAPWVRQQGHVAELLDAIKPPLEWIMNA